MLLQEHIQDILLEIIPQLSEEKQNKIIEKLVNLFEKESNQQIRQYIELWELIGFDTYTSQLNSIENKLEILLNKVPRTLNCQLADEASYMKFIVAKGNDERDKAINFLSDKLKDVKNLVICDPYLFHYKEKKKPTSNGYTQAELKNFATDFLDILPSSLERIDFFTRPKARNPTFTHALSEGLRKRNLKISSHKTDDIHDRVWIMDYSKAFVVGTSFNGLANKCSFILDLPNEDLQKFLQKLDELKRENKKSKSI